MMFEYQSITQLAERQDFILTEDTAQALAGEFLGQLVVDGAKALWRWITPERRAYPDAIENTDTPSL